MRDSKQGKYAYVTIIHGEWVELPQSYYTENGDQIFYSKVVLQRVKTH